MADDKDANGNENCLRHLQCPDCGNAGDQHKITIAAMADFVLSDDGTDLPDSGPEWDETATMSCGCGYRGTLGAFHAAYGKAHGE